MDNKFSLASFKLFKNVLSKNRGLTFIDLMVGLFILMIGITFLSMAYGFVNHSSANTRNIRAMEDIANDVAGRITARARDLPDSSTIGAISLDELNSWGSSRDVRYKTVTTRQAMDFDNLYRFDITVYHQDQDELVALAVDNEDEGIYRLSIFVFKEDDT